MTQCVTQQYENGLVRLPEWFKQDIPDMDKIRKMKGMFRGSHLHTVCESAHCPNMGQCWSEGVATFMILGEICTRACRFCNIAAGKPMQLDLQEPRNVALAVKALNLRFVVVTSVARDDLPDQGAGHFVKTIEEIRQESPQTKIEILIPDFSGHEDLLQMVCAAKPEVISQNLETVRRLALTVRPQASHDRTLEVLKRIKEINPSTFVKSSLMVGLGETDKEIIEALQELRDAQCDIVTIGQYLSPSRRKRHLNVERYVSPDQFKRYRHEGEAMGFAHIMAGPLVRSSYLAEQGYDDCLKQLGNFHETKA